MNAFVLVVFLIIGLIGGFLFVLGSIVLFFSHNAGGSEK